MVRALGMTGRSVWPRHAVGATRLGKERVGICLHAQRIPDPVAVGCSDAGHPVFMAGVVNGGRRGRLAGIRLREVAHDAAFGGAQVAGNVVE